MPPCRPTINLPNASGSGKWRAGIIIWMSIKVMREMLIESILFESGVPVLMVPYIGGQLPLKNVMVAWDGSPTASRAVHAAMPMRHPGKSRYVAYSTFFDASAAGPVLLPTRGATEPSAKFPRCTPCLQPEHR